MAVHETHEFAGDIAVEPGRPEGIAHGQHARAEDGKVDRADAARIAGRLQGDEDRRVRMIVADRADGIEAAQIVLEGNMVAVPGNHVEG